jgi:hypothetical protein
VSRTTPFYRYDPNLGDPRDTYRRADVVHPEARQPEMPAVFVANVEGETIINTMHGRRPIAWHAEPGTPCLILGYWSDGTVHLQWRAINGAYRVDGRFPPWVVRPDPEAAMAGGGRILKANDPGPVPTGVPNRLVMAGILAVVALVVLALPPVHDALGEVVNALARAPH